MRKKNYKGRCVKQKLSKSDDVLRFYSDIQKSYALLLDDEENIAQIRCNVPLDGLSGEYTTDFVCVKRNKDLLVRECVQRRHLTKPMTAKLLDTSRNYWMRHGVSDWGIVTDDKE